MLLRNLSLFRPFYPEKEARAILQCTDVTVFVCLTRSRRRRSHAGARRERWVVVNPAGEYEIVARYHALEAGFWHETVLSNPVKVKIVRKEPCPK